MSLAPFDLALTQRRSQRDSRGREAGFAHQILIDGAGGAAAFVDGPDDEGLPAAAVAGGEDAFKACGEAAVLGLEVRALVAFEAEHLADRLLGTEEAHRQEHELRLPDLLAAGLLLHGPLAVL